MDRNAQEPSSTSGSLITRIRTPDLDFAHKALHRAVPRSLT